ncbi:alanine--tRNA ligase [Candidatus Woesearchaeota archaeon]|nr:alanine--tRNA ligase [Candidatus Woesearchaeota archaeon]
MDIKQIKREFKTIASKNPEKYYAISVLQEQGFLRKQCKTCGTFFWTVNNDQHNCGDPSCSGGFRFFENPPAKKKLDYIEVWQEFAKHFQKLGYTPIKRYPVIARWREDTEFVQASIYDFQPYVVSGEVKPPANPLVVPQFCLRFNDIDNVGITGAHYTGFVMIGQHAFTPPKEFNQKKYFADIHSWLSKGLGLPNEEITFHEDAWTGGGNFGPCMEFFSRGLELGNQVYMLYEVTQQGIKKELNLNVLDMGMGHERNAWFTQAAATSYETTFPAVCKKLFHQTGIKVDKHLMQQFLPFSSYLNTDEVDDLQKMWQKIADQLKVDVSFLKSNVIPLSALFSIAEHTRSLLFALADGGLPSNVGGGYNLRVILRRALYFNDKYNWNLDLRDIAEEHADYLKPLFPELKENIANVQKILDVERHKYIQTVDKSKAIAQRIVKEEVTPAVLVKLYDSNGIAPELIAEEAKKLGKNVRVPDNFYALVASQHDKEKQEHETKVDIVLDIADVPATNILYFNDWKKIEFKAHVLKIIGRYIILDQTYFYPTSGGQLHDCGTIQNEPVVNVFKYKHVIVHELTAEHKIPEGEAVECKIDFKRRMQLAQHHTATHITNAAARTILGNHINQAGAKKTLEKAHIDITHFSNLTEDEVRKIEQEANRIIEARIPIVKKFYPRDEAEKLFGLNIYQGGVVPGKELRIVNIINTDVECCGGTHLDNTQEVDKIKIIKTAKIQDGIVRITFTAGNAAVQEESDESKAADVIAKLLQCEVQQIPARTQELFDKWKKAKKMDEKGEKIEYSMTKLTSTEEYVGDVIAKTCSILRTQPEHAAKTIERFKRELFDLCDITNI